MASFHFISALRALTYCMDLTTVADEMSLDAGLKIERSLYYGSFALQDRTEGMSAFVEKRQPVFNDN